jgi:hypothetical protein
MHLVASHCGSCNIGNIQMFKQSRCTNHCSFQHAPPAAVPYHVAETCTTVALTDYVGMEKYMGGMGQTTISYGYNLRIKCFTLNSATTHSRFL